MLNPIVKSGLFRTPMNDLFDSVFGEGTSLVVPSINQTNIVPLTILNTIYAQSTYIESEWSEILFKVTGIGLI